MFLKKHIIKKVVLATEGSNTNSIVVPKKKMEGVPKKK